VLIFFSLPRLGFFEISELLIVPGNLIGNWQVSLGAMVMSPVDFSPQLASVADIEQSDAASAKDADTKHVAPTTIESAATEKSFMASFPFSPGRNAAVHQHLAWCKLGRQCRF
jgi:hypothetical protein